jgi:cyclin C
VWHIKRSHDVFKCYDGINTPYGLFRYVADAGLDRGFLQTAWYIINDMYRSDLPLLYPPHMLALGAMLMATSINEQASKKVDVRAWFAKINVDMEEVK